MGKTEEILKRKRRSYLKEDYEVTTWESLEPFFNELKSRSVNTSEALLQWFKDRSELESVIAEDLGWRYIRMTSDTANEKHQENFNYFITEIQPNIAAYLNELNEKALESPYLEQIKEPGFDIIIRLLKKDKMIFRQENIPILTKIEQEAHTYGTIAGAMTVTENGKELTLQQAADFLQLPSRETRENIFLKINNRRAQDSGTLNALFSELVDYRNTVALNADFKNFRDYIFVALGRFDYDVNKCYEFHSSVEKEVVPVLNELASKRRKALNVSSLKPWDLHINYLGTTPLKPFNDEKDLIEKTIRCFHTIDPYLGACLTTMKNMGHLDLSSRKGKAPGGYNYPLDEIGVPFIFMNATSTLRDLVTLVHEGGHALHSFVTKDLPLNFFKHPPSEVAELASMSMELISMEHWDIFFPDEQELKRAKKEHLESIIQTLPWVATIDKFQHWIYENPHHNDQERAEAWTRIFSVYNPQEVNWEGLQQYKDIYWQKQLHLYEVPFYYIEYGIAQLGAIAVWKNYKKDKEKGFNDYLTALKLGYTKSVSEIYKTAGIKFDFSQPYIKELIEFVKNELDSL